jgi:hypothetical protein
MDIRADGLIDELMAGWMDEWTDVLMEVRIVNGWMDGWLEVRADGWMDG